MKKEKSYYIVFLYCFSYMQDLIEAAGHTLLYLPPYSPDLNPIEKKWAHAKHVRRTTDCSIDEIFSTHLRASFIRS